MDPRSERLPPQAEALLSQSDWVRKVVRGLGVDESSADDVLQSTWMAAIKNPPRTAGEGASLRAWVSRVARNFALKRLVRDDRRAARERAGAREERLPSAADVVEREEARAQVVRALLDVPEPWRTTLLLRFYECLEPRDIARLQRVPGSTVRNRLRRGLELLRERLERDLGPTWRQRCVLVLPLARVIPHAPGGSPSQGSATSPAGSSAPNWIPNGASGGGVVVEKIGLAAAGLLAAGGLALTVAWTFSGPDEDSSAGPALASELADGGGAGAQAPSEPPASSELVASDVDPSGASVPTRVDAAAPAAQDARCSLHGRLLGPDGEPIRPNSRFAASRFFYRLDRTRVAAGGGIGITLPQVPSGAVPEGGIEFRARSLDVLVAAGTGAMPVVEGPVDDLEQVEVTAGPTPPRNLLQGQYLLDASVGFQDGGEYEPRIVLSNASGEAYSTLLDGEGRFRIDGVRAGSWRLYAQGPGCRSKRMELSIGASEREKSLDVALDPLIRIPIQLVTPEGKDLHAAVLGMHLAGFVPVPFASRAPPGERTRDISLAPDRRYGASRWKNRWSYADESLGDASGFLEVYDALPMHVGVSAAGVVLESRIVSSDAEKVVFVIAPERIRALAATVALHVHSADDGQPIPNVVAHIESLSESMSDSTGALEFRNVPPGRRLLVIEAEGYEHREEWIEVLPGDKADLGARTLGRPRDIAGRVVDESGSPLELAVEFYSLDRRAPGSPLPAIGSAMSDAEGDFRIEGAGAGRFLVVVSEEDWCIEPTVVDTRAGAVEDLVLRATPRPRVQIVFPVEPTPDAIFLVETLDGIQVAHGECEGWAPLDAHLGDGRYRARLLDGTRVLSTRYVSVSRDAMVITDEPLEVR